MAFFTPLIAVELRLNRCCSWSECEDDESSSDSVMMLSSEASEEMEERSFLLRFAWVVYGGGGSVGEAVVLPVVESDEGLEGLPRVLARKTDLVEW